jgi:protein-S-isoprenylcysteine O-methyltransferase Ste14
MRKYLEWARRERSTPQVVAMLIVAAGVFIVALPVLVVSLAGWLDQAWGLPRMVLGPVNAVVGSVLLLGGGSFALWSVQAQAKLGKGSPLPMIPTRRLIVVPPYAYCRNPMVLGTVLAYLSIGVGLGSASAVGIVLLLAMLLLAYVKLVEEKELRLRFGPPYEEYLRATPLLLPRFTSGPPHR